MNLLVWLQNWYKNQCDGDWEHQYGVTIDTIDNPGWSVVIDLEGTELINKKFDNIQYDFGASNWIICQVVKNRFEGAGDPNRLEEIITYFKNWVEFIE